jgi:hypothetical protein
VHFNFLIFFNYFFLNFSFIIFQKELFFKLPSEALREGFIWGLFGGDSIHLFSVVRTLYHTVYHSIFGGYLREYLEDI